VVVTGIQSGLRDKDIMRMFSGWRPVAAEVVRNGNGKARPLAIVEFQSERHATAALESYTNQDNPKVKIRATPLMSYPGLVGDSCSLQGLALPFFFLFVERQGVQPALWSIISHPVCPKESTDSEGYRPLFWSRHQHKIREFLLCYIILFFVFVFEVALFFPFHIGCPCWSGKWWRRRSWGKQFCRRRQRQAPAS